MMSDVILSAMVSGGVCVFWRVVQVVQVVQWKWDRSFT